eukprot:CAMPEP_0179075390 /NCGR_PEP_ID=MMETSP0796-20121207/33569_1 /TAXON_ID=73915 /ORGANISM="Pyrodinium bahamense, Strain pbaha01" /LENGTH=288 /DNA_ID=CAMNT_0020772627 /DNA_START=155 /DNA_END=1022 /DNA_ORIENTATION=+
MVDHPASVPRLTQGTTGQGTTHHRSQACAAAPPPPGAKCQCPSTAPFRAPPGGCTDGRQSAPRHQQARGRAEEAPSAVCRPWTRSAAAAGRSGSCMLGVEVPAILASDLGRGNGAVPERVQCRGGEAPMVPRNGRHVVGPQVLARPQRLHALRAWQRCVGRDALALPPDVRFVLLPEDLRARGQALPWGQAHSGVDWGDVQLRLHAHPRQPAPVLVVEKLHRHGPVLMVHPVHHASGKLPLAAPRGTPSLDELQLPRLGRLRAAVYTLEGRRPVAQHLADLIVPLEGL